MERIVFKSHIQCRNWGRCGDLGYCFDAEALRCDITPGNFPNDPVEACAMLRNRIGTFTCPHETAVAVRSEAGVVLERYNLDAKLKNS